MKRYFFNNGKPPTKFFLENNLSGLGHHLYINKMFFLIFFKELIIRVFFCILVIILNFIIFFFFKEILLIFTINLFFTSSYIDIFPYIEFKTISILYYYYIKLCFFYSIIISIPFIFYQLYLFFINGLKIYEKKNIKKQIYILFFFTLLYYIFFKKYVILILYKLYLDLQINPEYNLGIAVDYNFQINSFINIIYIYLYIFFFIIFMYIFVLLKKKIDIKIIYMRKLYIYLFFFLIFFIIPPLINLQLIIFIILFFFSEFIIFILGFYTK